MKKALLLLAFCAHFGTSLLAQHTDSVTITGKIAGYDPNEHELFVRVSVDDEVLYDGVNFMAQVEEDGQFSMKVLLYYPQTIIFGFEKQGLTIFANHGDSIHLDFPAFAFRSESSDILSEDHVIFGGDGFEMNSLIARYISKWHPFGQDFNKKKEGITDHVAFKQFATERRAEQKKFLQDFVREEKVTNATFLRWAEAQIEFDYCLTLLLPLDFHPKAPLFPIEWYDFIHDVPMDKLDVAMSSYSIYLNYIRAYLFKRFNRTEPIASMNRRKEYSIGIMLDSLCANTHGLTQEFILTHYFANAAGYAPSKEKFMEYLPRYFDLVKHERCRAHIKKEYGLTPPEALPPDFLAKLESAQIPDSLKEVLPLILEKHKGKVVVLDFWATWCGPCMAELERFYPAFIPKFKEEEVAFVFLAGKSPKAKWQQTVNGFQFKGDHYLLTDNQDAVLKQLFQISGIPHHVLIDRDGNVADPKFNPSGQAGEQAIRKLLGN